MISRRAKVALLLAAVGGVGLTAYGRASAYTQIGSVRVTPNGPTDGGDYGPNTPATMTSGIQEALDSGKNVSITAPSCPIIYPIRAPLTLRTTNQQVRLDNLATIQVLSQIDGGIFQVVDNGLSGITIQGGVLDANNLSMMGVWIPKICPGLKLLNFELKNIMAVYGLQTQQNPGGVLAVAIGGHLYNGLYIHDINSPNYNGGSGAFIRLTGNLGLTEPENTVVSYCYLQNGLNVAPGQLIHGIFFDVNTLALTSDHNTVQNIKGDAHFITAGGTDPTYGPNFSNRHVVKYATISGVRVAVNLEAYAGGQALYTAASNNLVSSCAYGMAEDVGADYTAYMNNTVDVASVNHPFYEVLPGGAHDSFAGNTGFGPLQMNISLTADNQLVPLGSTVRFTAYFTDPGGNPIADAIADLIVNGSVIAQLSQSGTGGHGTVDLVFTKPGLYSAYAKFQSTTSDVVMVTVQ